MDCQGSMERKNGESPNHQRAEVIKKSEVNLRIKQ